MRRHVLRFTSGCLACRRANTTSQHSLGNPHPVLVTQVWQQAQVDLMLGLPPPPPPPPPSIAAILTIIDVFSRHLVTIALSHSTATTVADALVCCCFCLVHGLPPLLQSHHGPPFISSFWHRVMERFSISHPFTTTHHPQAQRGRWSAPIAP